MSEGLQFARLATYIGKKNAALWAGHVRVTIAAVGIQDGERFVQAIDRAGTVLLGPVSDFSIFQPSRSRGNG